LVLSKSDDYEGGGYVVTVVALPRGCDAEHTNRSLTILVPLFHCLWVSLPIRTFFPEANGGTVVRLERGEFLLHPVSPKTHES
jgi:hypothetical protein